MSDFLSSNKMKSKTVVEFLQKKKVIVRNTPESNEEDLSQDYIG